MLQLARGARRAQPRQPLLSPLTGGASQINIYGAVEGASVYRPNALTGDPNHLGIMLIVPLLVLAPIYLRLERGHRAAACRSRVLLAFLLVVELATLSRSGLLGLGVGAARARASRTGGSSSRAALLAAARRVAALLVAIVVAARRDFFETVLRSRVADGGGSTSAHFDVYDFIPQILHTHPLLRARAEQLLGLLRVRHRQDELGPALVLRRAARRDGPRRDGPVRASSSVCLFRRLRAARALGRALAASRDPLAARVRPLAWGLTAALAGTMAANVFYLTMQFYYFYAFAAHSRSRVPIVFARRPMKVVVLTTSYPRSADDAAGRFVADAVERLRAAGVEVDVVAPRRFRHFGIAYGGGDRAEPARGRGSPRSLPAFLGASTRGRRAGRLGTPTSCTRTGSRRARSRSRPAGRSCSSCRGRTSSSPGARRRSPAPCCAARGWRSRRRRRSPRTRARLGAERCA